MQGTEPAWARTEAGWVDGELGEDGKITGMNEGLVGNNLIT